MREGFVRESVSIDADELLSYLVPLLEPLRDDEFTFERAWLRGEALRLADLRKVTTGMKLNLPPSYLLIHRVTLGVMGVLCQLGATAPFRDECEKWLPGFAAPIWPGVSGIMKGEEHHMLLPFRCARPRLTAGSSEPTTPGEPPHGRCTPNAQRVGGLAGQRSFGAAAPADRCRGARAHVEREPDLLTRT